MIDPFELDANCERLIRELEGIDVLNGRYERMVHINRGEGCFSIVFKAFDKITQRHVILKFYKIHASLLSRRERIAGFENEPVLLEHLIDKDRCLQLLQGMNTYDLQIPQPHGGPIRISCGYFVTEWCNGDVKDYFLSDEKVDALDNLKAFRNLLLAVNILHANHIAHRDLKEDNFRLAQRKHTDVAVAIDLGSGVHTQDGKKNGAPYPYHKGASGYASPEAMFGLAVVRRLAVSTDIYALGCMLFEIFNKGYYGREMIESNRWLDVHYATMKTYLPEQDASDADLLTAWNKVLNHFGRHFNPIRITANGHIVPRAIWQELNDLMQGMTHFDYRQRYSLEKALHKLDRCITCIENERLAIRQVERKKTLRQQRVEKQREKDQRLIARQCELRTALSKVASQ